MRAILFFGILLLLFTHTIYLSSLTGLHYDEAWAALFAHQILTKPSFWPIQAMSPYTSAWGNYVSALFFKLMGVSLLNFRLSGVTLAVLGILIGARALWDIGKKHWAIALIWVCAVSDPLVCNHRFAIEVTTFQVFCLGVLAWGLVQRIYFNRLYLGWLLIFLASFFGVTSHILFLAPVLATLVWASLTGGELKRADRLGAGVTLFSLFPFFFRIVLQIPEKDKALALLLIIASAFFWICFLNGGKYLSPKFRSHFTHLVIVLSLPVVGLMLFFQEGSWANLFFMGALYRPLWAGWSLIPLLAAVILFFREKISPSKLLLPALILIGVAGMAIKPTLRHAEISLLLLAVGLSWVFTEAKISPKIRAGLMGFFFLTQALQLGFNYFDAGLKRQNAQAHDFRFTIFHDTSIDSLPIQDLVKTLGSQGCSRKQVVSQNPRIATSLDFLSLGDWQVSPSRCPDLSVDIERDGGILSLNK